MLLFLVPAAFAQEIPAVNAQLFRPSVDAAATLWTDDTGSVEGKAVIAKVVGGWVEDPLIFVTDAGEEVDVLGRVVHSNVVLGFRHGRYRIGLDTPIFLLTQSDLGAGGAGIGDVALDGRVNLADHDVQAVGLAVAARVSVPTSTTDLSLGSPGLAWEATLIGDVKVGDLLVAANVGTRGLPTSELGNVAINDQLVLRLGGGYALTPAAGVSVDLASQITYGNPLSNRYAKPTEVLAGGYWRSEGGFAVRGGLGTGITRGIGAPTLRAVLSVGFEPASLREKAPPPPPEPDTDGDGVFDSADRCPAELEDRDGFADDDGCLDVDNDQDGVLDADDKCPTDAEDRDGYKDEDGCVDAPTKLRVRLTDPNGNPIPGAASFITSETIAQKGAADVTIEVNPGSYAIDGGAPGYEPIHDEFVVPETTEVFERTYAMKPVVILGTAKVTVKDPDGKPVDAKWSIGRGDPVPITGGAGEAQLTPGNYEFLFRADGFGPQRVSAVIEAKGTANVEVVMTPNKVVVEAARIDVNGIVHFETNQATIQPQSYPLLREVADILLDHPDIEIVRVEGHTDSRGDAAANLKLSKARAAAVKDFLVKAGVPAERLQSEGYGETRPVNPAETEEAWAENRRVDFVVVKRKGEAPATP